MPGPTPRSKWRETLSRWANAEDADAREMLRTQRDEGFTSIADAPDRLPVRLRGTLRTVTLRPRGGVPALEAELFDGGDTVVLIWLGRRRISGIAPGITIEVEGRIGRHGDDRVLYNPRYELRAR